ncbi:hypothetical protein CN906_05340 [Bacillus toyonensis]|uniref:hypothetical protein n=1 Tax=Bacillus toyonensis TaxID=155322 RepID=UPI000BF20BC8|nr:hypothetical protein [Bacillus toyonensis]PEJ66300.1 hypothetical protein CN906_05340 [Bacillus toyonensis]PEP82970.1 hypothetical protein CN581_07950 [Bacillus toyonensis]
MKNILKFAFHYSWAIVSFIYLVLTKLAPLHSYVLWFHPKEFVTYTTSLNNLVAANVWKVVALLMVAGNLWLFAKVYKLEKKSGDDDEPKPKTRSERHKHKRSAK